MHNRAAKQTKHARLTSNYLAGPQRLTGSHAEIACYDRSYLPASAMTCMQWVCSLRQPASSLSRGSQLQRFQCTRSIQGCLRQSTTSHTRYKVLLLVAGTRSCWIQAAPLHIPDKGHAQQEVDNHLTHARGKPGTIRSALDPAKGLTQSQLFSAAGRNLAWNSYLFGCSDSAAAWEAVPAAGCSASMEWVLSCSTSLLQCSPASSPPDCAASCAARWSQ